MWTRTGTPAVVRVSAVVRVLTNHHHHLKAKHHRLSGSCLSRGSCLHEPLRSLNRKTSQVFRFVWTRTGAQVRVSAVVRVFTNHFDHLTAKHHRLSGSCGHEPGHRFVSSAVVRVLTNHHHHLKAKHHRLSGSCGHEPGRRGLVFDWSICQPIDQPLATIEKYNIRLLYLSSQLNNYNEQG
jgi:hypothetical protein